MRVLLISANTEMLDTPVLPLGLAQIAAATEREGHDVEMVDLLQAEGRQRLETALGARPDVIGISVRNIDDQNMQAPRFLLQPVRDVVQACRNACPEVPIVLGGAGYSIFPDAALAYVDADYGVRGEGEEVFPALLARLERREGVAELPAVHRSMPTSRGAGWATVRDDLDAFEWADPGTWLRTAPRDCWVPVQSRRGCPLDCSYCSTSSIEGRDVRYRSPRLVARDLARARDAGFRRFFFVDNTFNLPESYARQLCEEIRSLALDIEWRCILYPSALSAGLVTAMREAGCVEASVGFDSGNQRVLESLNKDFAPATVRGICDALAGHGIRRNGFLLLGGPAETRQSIDESLAFADSLHLDMLSVRLGIRLYPGTPLHRRAIAEGMVAPADDLLRPTFYLARGLESVSEELKGRLGRW